MLGITERQLREEIEPILRAFEARHLVVGHMVTLDGVRTRCNGALIMIDAGFSRTYVGAPPACLLVEDGIFFNVTLGGKERLPVTGLLQTH